jgi:hypothetical protein
MDKMGKDAGDSPTNPPKDSNISIGQHQHEACPTHIEEKTVESPSDAESNY